MTASNSGSSEPRPPVRLSVLARRIGISKDKLRDDVDRGYLTVTWIKCGTRKMGLVDEREARRYMVAIGAVTAESVASVR